MTGTCKQHRVSVNAPWRSHGRRISAGAHDGAWEPRCLASRYIHARGCRPCRWRGCMAPIQYPLAHHGALSRRSNRARLLADVPTEHLLYVVWRRVAKTALRLLLSSYPGRQASVSLARPRRQDATTPWPGCARALNWPGYARPLIFLQLRSLASRLSYCSTPTLYLRGFVAFADRRLHCAVRLQVS